MLIKQLQDAFLWNAKFHFGILFLPTKRPAGTKNKRHIRFNPFSLIYFNLNSSQRDVSWVVKKIHQIFYRSVGTSRDVHANIFTYCMWHWN